MEGTVITKKGIQLLAKIIASKSVLNITRAAVGTGKILNGYDPSNMVDLIEYKMDAAICGCNANGDTAEIVMQISSTGIETGFIISEIGVFAEDPDEGEILYAYIDLSDDMQYMYPEGGQEIKFIEVTLDVVIAEGTKVTAYINPFGLIKREEFEECVEELNKEIGKKVSTEASQRLSETQKKNARDNIGAGTSSFSGNYNDLSNRPTIPTSLPANGGDADTVDGIHIEVVSALPQDAANHPDTLYIIQG